MNRTFILLFFVMISLTSCTSIWSIKGDITAYNQDGSILKKWDDVTIETGVSNALYGHQTANSATKLFGLNFIDPVSGKGIILGNSVPYIIEYNTSKEYDSYDNQQQTEYSNTPQNGYSREEMERWIDVLENAYNTNKEIIKNKTTSKKEKQEAKKANVRIYQQLTDTRDEYYRIYNKQY